jgi:hypothetical protein
MNARKFAVFAITAALTLTPLFAGAEQVLWLKGDKLGFLNKQVLYKFVREAGGTKVTGKLLIVMKKGQDAGQIFGTKAQPVRVVEVDGEAVTIKLQSREEIAVFPGSLEIKEK